jgi:hypothetical protein
LAHAAGYPTDASKHSSYATRENEMYRLVVLFLSYTGVRFGEMAALKVKRLGLPRCRAVIAESVTPVQGLGLVWGTPKTHHVGRFRSPRSWSPTWPSTSPARRRRTWCSAGSAMGSPFA